MVKHPPTDQIDKMPGDDDPTPPDEEAEAIGDEEALDGVAVAPLLLVEIDVVSGRDHPTARAERKADGDGAVA